MQVIADNLHRAIAVVSRSRDLEVSENEHVSELFLKVRFKIEQGNLK